MSRVPDEIATEVLVACGRYCCLCKQFKPTELQVHHIVPREKGGTADLDNLIPLCLLCHSHVHTQRRFARGFTPHELKQHRDDLYRLVAENKPVSPPTGIVSLMEILRHEIDPSNLTREAIRILIIASEATHGMFVHDLGGGCIITDPLGGSIESSNPRGAYRLRDGVGQLQTLGLLRYNGANYEATRKGCRVAELLIQHAKRLQAQAPPPSSPP